MAFMKKIRNADEKFRIVDVFTVCVIPNHFHILVKVPRRFKDASVISDFMNMLQKSYAQHYKRRYGSPETKIGQFYEGRFRDKKIESIQQLERCYNYIIHNAVRHGIVDHSKKWPWTSYHKSFYDKLVTIDEDIVISDTYELPYELELEDTFAPGREKNGNNGQ